jgi:hypothetical protein
MKKLMSLALMALTLASCRPTSLDSSEGLSNLLSIGGLGNPYTQARRVGTFKRIRLQQGMRLVYEYLPDQTEFKLELTADANLHRQIMTEVVKDALLIRSVTSSNIGDASSKVVTVTGPAIEGIQLSGQSEAIIELGEHPKFDLEVLGASKVTATGTLPELKLVLSTRSQLVGTDLSVKTLDATLRGSSVGELKVSDSLSVDLSDSSTLTYHGDPKITSEKVTGQSNLTKKSLEVLAPE